MPVKDTSMEELFEAIVSTIANWKEAETKEEYRAQLKERRAFRRTFADWHYSGGAFVGKRVQGDLQEIWRLSSAKMRDDAKYRLQVILLRYTRELRSIERYPSSIDYESKVRAFKTMVATLQWLQNRLGRLKVCENPKCATERKYFFRDYSNDRYCCIKCGARAKALRQAKSDRELHKPPKEYKRPEEQRQKMSDSATARWAKARAETGKPK